MGANPDNEETARQPKMSRQKDCFCSPHWSLFSRRWIAGEQHRAGFVVLKDFVTESPPSNLGIASNGVHEKFSSSVCRQLGPLTSGLSVFGACGINIFHSSIETTERFDRFRRTHESSDIIGRYRIGSPLPSRSGGHLPTTPQIYL